MNKISFISNSDYNLSLRANKENSVSGFNNLYYNTEYMTSDASFASRAYGLSFINKNKTIPQMSLKNMIKWLESQGKIEGKDFDIDSSCTLGNTLLRLKNKQGEEELCVHYDNGNHLTWSGYEVTEFKNGCATKMVGRDCDGNIKLVNKIFNKNDESIQHLTKDFSYEKSPEEYVNYLKNNDTNYSIEYSGEEENNRSVNIDIYDNNKNKVKSVWYYYGERNFDEPCCWVSQKEYNEQGKEYRRLTFDKDNIEVTSYVNYL